MLPDQIKIILLCREQIELKKKLVCEDCVIWGDSTDPFSDLNLIGGVDISFPKGDADHACACLVVLTFPELEVRVILECDVLFVYDIHLCTAITTQNCTMHIFCIESVKS